MQSHAVSVSCSGYLLIPFDGSGKYQRVAVGLAMRLGNAVTRPALRGVLTSRMQGRRGQLFCGGVALEPKMQIRRQEVNDRHVERLRHVCAKRLARFGYAFGLGGWRNLSGFDPFNIMIPGFSLRSFNNAEGVR